MNNEHIKVVRREPEEAHRVESIASYQMWRVKNELLASDHFHATFQTVEDAEWR